MPFLSPPYMASLSVDKRRSLGSNIGYHPDTLDDLYLPDADRYAGTYVLGTQGNGKSQLLLNMITADMEAEARHAVIVIDAHPDLVVSCLNHVPKDRLPHTYVLDMEDEAFPFGLSLYSHDKLTTSLERTTVVSRILHVFEVLWPEVANQQYIPLYLPKAIQVFIDNPGSSMADMLPFFQDDMFRSRMLQQVTDPSIRNFWHNEYDGLKPSERDQKIKALTNRLHLLFTGNSLVSNILGQRRSTINFRRAIEQKQILLVKLPMTRIPDVARLIGTILLAQIQAAVFSFADTSSDRRPSVSLYMDEFQNFATKDIEKLFSEGRKFGMRLTVAHQRRDQLSDFLRSATASAYTTICFNLTPESAREMAYLFPSNEATVQPEDIELHPVHYLLTHPSTDPVIKLFTDVYLHPLQGHKRGTGRVEIEMRGSAPSLGDIMNGGRAPNPRVTDPTWHLDSLLHEVMREGNPNLPIPVEIVTGFSNCGRNFFKQARGMAHDDVRLQADARYPKHLVVLAAGEPRWTRKPESGSEQLYHFIFHLRLVMQRLAEKPIGKATTTTPTEIARMLTNLPKRAAFVRSGDTIGVIYTHNTPPPLTRIELYERAKAILFQTRAAYCYPREVVERNMLPASQAQPQQVAPVSRWEEVE